MSEKGLAFYSDSGEPVALEGFISDITEIKSYRERLEHQASHDALTGLANRNLLHDRLHQAIAHAERQRLQLAVAFLDLDNFKYLNDSLGHSAGDELLKMVAQRLKTCVREGDTVARLGGDEFVLVLVDQSGAEAVNQVVQRVLETASEPFLRGWTGIQHQCQPGREPVPAGRQRRRDLAQERGRGDVPRESAGTQ